MNWEKKIEECYIGEVSSPDGIPVVKVNPDTVKHVIQGIIQSEKLSQQQLLESLEEGVEKIDEYEEAGQFCGCISQVKALIQEIKGKL